MKSLLVDEAASSTNNGLESLNAQIKKTGTLREQLSISAFFERALKIVEEKV